MTLEGFYAICDALEPDEKGCRIWRRLRRQITRTRTARYIMVCVNERNVSVHRLASERKLGRSINPGLICCHHCDDPHCVEPSHLYEGTPKDNAKDRGERNHEWRKSRPRGGLIAWEKHREEKLEQLTKGRKACWNKYRCDPEYRARTLEPRRLVTAKHAAILQPIAWLANQQDCPDAYWARCQEFTRLGGVG
jgi:hypothetical protein